MGDSAGGGLSLALAMYLRDAGYSNLMPRALVLMSPWVDLTMSCGSWDENAPYDVVPQPGQDGELVVSMRHTFLILVDRSPESSGMLPWPGGHQAVLDASLCVAALWRFPRSAADADTSVSIELDIVVALLTSVDSQRRF